MTVTVGRTRFQPLPVGAVEQLTDDAVAITFLVPPESRAAYAFAAGQHVTVSTEDGGRRSYSLCSTPAELAEHGVLRNGVKQIPGGAFSTVAAGALRPGDTVPVLPPLGRFTSDFAPGRARHYAAVAAGSGITPVLSLIATALGTEPKSQFTLVYGNRYARSVMFAEELADLKDRYPSRLHLVHVLSREPSESALLSGRLDAGRLAALLDVLVDPSTVDEWFLCGPYAMVLAAQALLVERAPLATVHSELFHVDEAPPAAPVRAADAGETAVTMVLDGRSSQFGMARDERVLDAALRVRSELPYACRGGVCSTCRAKVLDGEVTMARNYALTPSELTAGYVLTCQSSPVTDTLTVDYDA